MDRNDHESRGRFIPWFSEEYDGPEYRNTIVRDYLSLTPQEIKTELEKHVVNQEKACRKIAIMMYQHLQGHRFVGLIAGPTGSGKSFIAESLKEIFPDVVYIRDVSNVTQDGWKGDKKVSSLFCGVHNPYSYNGRIYPMIFLDECDKLFSPRTNSGGENVSETTQAEFLTVIHGGEIKIGDKEIIDTRRMSFLFAGAFEKKANAISEKEAGPSIGFGASQEKVQSYSRDLTMEDVHDAGCLTELCGRIQRIVSLNKFGEDDYREMLDITDRGPLYEIEKEFSLPIHISEKKKEEIAHDAFLSGLGIRGIKNMIRDYIDEIIWEDCHTKEFDIS